MTGRSQVSPSSYRPRAPEHSSLDPWLQGAQALREQARIAWLLGEALEAGLRAASQATPGPDPHQFVQQWQRRIQEAMSAGPGRNAPPPQEAATQLHPPPAGVPSRSQRIVPSWAELTRQRLHDHRFPVLFIGGHAVRGQQVVLAVGVDLPGHKHVLSGVEGGHGTELPPALAARGLDAAEGMLVVTDGSRALDEAVSATWRGRVLIQHCQHRLRWELGAHLPEARALSVATELAGLAVQELAAAHALLTRLHRQLTTAHPGAAQRLQRSMEASLTVARLGVAPPLRGHLEQQGVIRVVCRQTAQAQPGRAGLEAVAAGLGAWLQRTRRLVGYQALADLAAQLREQVASARR